MKKQKMCRDCKAMPARYGYYRKIIKRLRSTHAALLFREEELLKRNKALGTDNRAKERELKRLNAIYSKLRLDIGREIRMIEGNSRKLRKIV
jgi:hypothetical protein